MSESCWIGLSSKAVGRAIAVGVDVTFARILVTFHTTSTLLLLGFFKGKLTHLKFLNDVKTDDSNLAYL